MGDESVDDEGDSGAVAIPLLTVVLGPHTFAERWGPGSSSGGETGSIRFRRCLQRWQGLEALIPLMSGAALAGWVQVLLGDGSGCPPL